MPREPSPLAECQYPKLVRDYMPAIISRDGRKPIYKQLKDDEYREALKKKLSEEFAELLDAIDQGDKKSITEELGDMFDVLTALSHSHNIFIDDVEMVREQKGAVKGKFGLGIWMEAVELNG